jgi:ArsR family transcriptional regulator
MAPTALRTLDLLCTLAEPTRLRLLNCLAAAPLFVSDLQAILALPQPTVSRHLTVLRQAGAVQDTQLGAFVLYRLRPETTPAGRLVRAVLDALVADEGLQLERHRARDRSRSRTRFLMERTGA